MPDQRSIEQEVRRLLRRWRMLRRTPPVTLTPGSPFEALLEQRIAGLMAQVDELKGRVNGLIFVVLGAAVLELLMRLLR